MKITIRKCEPSDFEAVYHFINLLENTEFSKEKQFQIFSENLKNTNHLFYIAENEEKPIGFLSCMVQNLIHHSGPIGEIQEMIVLPEYRGFKVGKVLIEHLISEAKRKNILQLEVTSGLQRVKAHEFYLREGFLDTHKKFTMNISEKP